MYAPSVPRDYALVWRVVGVLGRELRSSAPELVVADHAYLALRQAMRVRHLMKRRGLVSWLITATTFARWWHDSSSRRADREEAARQADERISS